MMRAKIGSTVTVELPYSEACMHMRVAGKTMEVLVLQNGAQLFDSDGKEFSFPITHGEAGIIAEPADCLHSWVAGMMVVAEEDLDTVAAIRPVECEKCEATYPRSITL